MGLTERGQLLCCLALVAACCIAGICWLQPLGYGPADWAVYRDAVYHWREPYHLPGPAQYFFNPPWVLPLLAPFVILPMPVGAGLMMTASLITYTLLAKYFKLSLWATGLFLLSAPVVTGLAWGQINWLVLLGLLMPPWLGLFFVLLKPQVGLGIALYWLWQAGQEKRAIRTFAPVTAAFLLSFLVYGFWPLAWAHLPWAPYFWPESIAVGMALMALAMRRRDIKHAVMSSPFFSPYAYTHSWAGALLSVMSHSWQLALAAWALSWAVHLLWYGG